MPKVLIPSALQTIVGGATEITAAGDTVRAVIADLEAQHAGIAKRILDEEGELRKFVNLFLNDEDIRTKDGLATPIAEDDTLNIVPAVSGG